MNAVFLELFIEPRHVSSTETRTVNKRHYNSCHRQDKSSSNCSLFVKSPVAHFMSLLESKVKDDQVEVDASCSSGRNKSSGR